jgi:DinB superfamily
MSTPLLEFQLTGSFDLLDSLVDEISDTEWTLKVNHRANMIGFTVWHCVRTIDWTINRVAARRNELVVRAEWRDVRPDGAFFGAGATMESADRVARAVNRDRTRDYLSALRTETLAWLRETSDEDLDRLVDLNADDRDTDHLQPAVWAEVKDLDRIPVWQLLARPAISHIRLHCGEVEAQLQAMRAERRERRSARASDPGRCLHGQMQRSTR